MNKRERERERERAVVMPLLWRVSLRYALSALSGLGSAACVTGAAAILHVEEAGGLVLQRKRATRKVQRNQGCWT